MASPLRSTEILHGLPTKNQNDKGQTLNIITREIMARFNLEAKDALEVQQIVEDYYPIDYSEAEAWEHHLAYDLAFAHWKSNGEITLEDLEKIEAQYVK